jgi:hypothetical protein
MAVSKQARAMTVAGRGAGFGKLYPASAGHAPEASAAVIAAPPVVAGETGSQDHDAEAGQSSQVMWGRWRAPRLKRFAIAEFY